MGNKYTLVDQTDDIAGISILKETLFPPYHEFDTKLICHTSSAVDISISGIVDIPPKGKTKMKLTNNKPIKQIRVFSREVTEVFNDPKRQQYYLLINKKFITYHQETDLDLLVSSNDQELRYSFRLIDKNATVTILS